jgi:hypothetical protein
MGVMRHGKLDTKPIKSKNSCEVGLNLYWALDPQALKAGKGILQEAEFRSVSVWKTRTMGRRIGIGFSSAYIIGIGLTGIA